MPEYGFAKKYGYSIATGVLFLVSLGAHWGLAWPAYVQEAEEHGEEPSVRDYFIETGRDTFENWQSEFLQLIWQVAGLAFLWHVGSPQSKSENEKEERKMDAILRAVDPENAERILKELDKEYPSK